MPPCEVELSVLPQAFSDPQPVSIENILADPCTAGCFCLLSRDPLEPRAMSDAAAIAGLAALAAPAVASGAARSLWAMPIKFLSLSGSSMTKGSCKSRA